MRICSSANHSTQDGCSRDEMSRKEVTTGDVMKQVETWYENSNYKMAFNHHERTILQEEM
jgi:hypothetical protein